jgi:hypothetical protein
VGNIADKFGAKIGFSFLKTREEGKWGIGEMGKWENEEMGKWGNEKMGKCTSKTSIQRRKGR